MKKLLAMLLMIAMLLTFTACGGSADEDTAAKDTVSQEVQETEEVQEEAAPAAETVAVGNTITLPFAEMTISEAAIANNIKTSIKTGSITYTTGPDEKADTEYVYIRGTLKNTSKAEISMINIEGTVEIDGYSYELDNLTIIESDGSSTYSLAPLKTYSYTLSAEVPNELAQSAAPCNVTFGINENFESGDPFAEEPTYDYTYAISIAK